MQNLKPFINSLQNFAQKRLQFQEPPKLFLKQDQENAQNVFGKTGTARIFKNQQYNEDLHNALFIGMTELDEKKYLVGLLVKDPIINGDGGGDVAAPIFSEIIETIQNF